MKRLSILLISFLYLFIFVQPAFAAAGGGGDQPATEQFNWLLFGAVICGAMVIGNAFYLAFVTNAPRWVKKYPFWGICALLFGIFAAVGASGGNWHNSTRAGRIDAGLKYCGTEIRNHNIVDIQDPSYEICLNAYVKGEEIEK